MIYICQKFKDEQEIQELCSEQKTGDALKGNFWQEKLQVVKLKVGNLMWLFVQYSLIIWEKGKIEGKRLMNMTILKISPQIIQK